MEFSTLVFNPFRENTYILWDGTGECVIIDAGASNEREQQRLSEFIAKRSLRPVMAVNTHGHLDHLFGVSFLKQMYDIPFAINSLDSYLVRQAPRQAEMYGVVMEDVPELDIDLRSEDEIHFGNTILKLIHTPGHTPGHIVIYEPVRKLLFTGDLLFKGSIGRTDLPGGDYDVLMKSVIENILPLGGEVQIYPGHGYESTIGYEALNNPFITEVISGDTLLGDNS